MKKSKETKSTERTGKKVRTKQHKGMSIKAWVHGLSTNTLARQVNTYYDNVSSFDDTEVWKDPALMNRMELIDYHNQLKAKVDAYLEAKELSAKQQIDE